MQRGIRSALTSFALGAFGVLAGIAYAQAPAGGDPVKLGLIDIYGGGFAFIADSIRTGFQIAVDEANQAGGLNGRPFELVTADMGGSVEKAVTEARRMILEEKIKFVTVGIHSGAAVAVGNLGQEYKVLVIGGIRHDPPSYRRGRAPLRRARQPLDGGDRPPNGRLPQGAGRREARCDHCARL